jgi:hypothetical protein
MLRPSYRTRPPSFATLVTSFNFISSSIMGKQLGLVTEVKNLVVKPGVYCLAQLVEFAGKKMIDSLNHYKLILARYRGNEPFDLLDSPVFVLASMHKQLGFRALSQERKVRAVDGNTQPYQVSNARIFAPDAHTDPRAKAEPRKQQRHPGNFCSKKIKRGANVVLLALAAIVNPGAKSGATKIKSQNRNTQGVQRLRRLVNHLVVHRAAKQRMRVANHAGKRRSPGRRWLPENRFKPSSRPFQKEIAGFVGCRHRCAKYKFAV